MPKQSPSTLLDRKNFAWDLAGTAVWPDRVARWLTLQMTVHSLEQALVKQVKMLPEPNQNADNLFAGRVLPINQRYFYFLFVFAYTQRH